MKNQLVAYTQKNGLLLACLFVAGLLSFLGTQATTAQQRKSAEELADIRQANVAPSQKGIDVDTLTEAELQTATLQQEGTKGYTLKNANGVTIRTLFDTDGDGQLDQWGFYKDGIEVYRDIHADGGQQMRWLNTGGTKWGIGKSNDGVINSWKVISPDEVAEEVVLALATRDFNRFQRVALTAEDLKSLQCGQDLTQKLENVVKQQQQSFQQALQEVRLSANAQLGQFFPQRPATIPAGTNGSTKDLTFYSNPVIQVNEGDGIYLHLGSMVKMGDVWKIIEAPKPYDGNNEATIIIGSSGGENIPIDIQKLIQEIQDLEVNLNAASSQTERTAIYDKIILKRLGVATKYANEYNDPANRDKWLRDLADFIYAAVAKDGYPSGISKLETIGDGMIKSNNNEIAAYMQYRIVEATYVSAQTGVTGEGAAAAYNARISGLEQLVKNFPNTMTTAMVELELIGEYEMTDQLDEAKKSAQAVISGYPNTPMAEKATGFLHRMDSLGKPFEFQGTSSTGSTIDVKQYKGKIVLLYFWASWADPTGTEATAMKALMRRYERDGLSIIGVCMDESADAMQAYVTQNAIAWPSILESGGQNSRPAIYAGINMPPFFILLDKEGKVANNHLLLPEDVDRAIFSLIRGE